MKMIIMMIIMKLLKIISVQLPLCQKLHVKYALICRSKQSPTPHPYPFTHPSPSQLTHAQWGSDCSFQNKRIAKCARDFVQFQPSKEFNWPCSPNLLDVDAKGNERKKRKETNKTAKTRHANMSASETYEM